MQTDVRDIVGLVPDHHDKANHTGFRVFGSPVLIKVRFTLSCSLLKGHNSTVSLRKEKTNKQTKKKKNLDG